MKLFLFGWCYYCYSLQLMRYLWYLCYSSLFFFSFSCQVLLLFQFFFFSTLFFGFIAFIMSNHTFGVNNVMDFFVLFYSCCLSRLSADTLIYVPCFHFISREIKLLCETEIHLVVRDAKKKRRKKRNAFFLSFVAICSILCGRFCCSKTPYRREGQ